MKRILAACSALAVSGVIVFATGVAIADTDTYINKNSGPCADDVRRYCRDVKPGAGRIWSCLKGYETDLSPRCRTFRVEQREKMREFHAACRTDVSRYCGGVPAGKGNIIACLRTKKANLSQSCMSFFERN